jgi:nitrite reductase/ring-hydroxylating ferredoxin subunit
MKPAFIEDRVTRQGWVAPTEKALDAISGVTVQKSGSAVRNFLHGVWLGHPFHVATVDVPIGALTTATVLDVSGAAKDTDRFQPGADAALALGLITAGVAATAGLADWSKSDQPARRVGVLHAVFNGAASLCYASSWLLRRRGQRNAATGASVTGWVLLAIGGYLGGRMVYNHRLGVDHSERVGAKDFTPVMPDSELPEDEPHRVEAEGAGILLVRREGRVLAIGEKCAHLGGPLEQGKLEGDTITCPWHGSKFNLKDGSVVEGPAVYAQPCYEVRVRNGQIEVRINRKM